MLRSVPVEGADYKAQRKSYGGSNLGRERRDAPLTLKLAVHRWTISVLCEGDETRLSHDSARRPRFSPRLYEDCVLALDIWLHAEYEEYLGGREDRALNIIMQRVHKMYYGQTKSTKGRGSSSREHPKNWSHADLAAAESRLSEVGWPW